jgi:hypothetical protein
MMQQNESCPGPGQMFIFNTVVFGYNDNGYNEFMAITY